MICLTRELIKHVCICHKAFHWITILSVSTEDTLVHGRENIRKTTTVKHQRNITAKLKRK